MPWKTPDMSDYASIDGYAEEPQSLVTYDYAPGGALLLQYEGAPEFKTKLRAVVPEGFISYARTPFHWVIDADYADDALKLCRQEFEYVEHGDIE